MNREQYLAWCKKRALEHVEAGELNLAIVSMMSDLRKRADTDMGQSAGPMTMAGVELARDVGADGVRWWIGQFD